MEKIIFILFIMTNLSIEILNFVVFIKYDFSARCDITKIMFWKHDFNEKFKERLFSQRILPQ